MDVFRLAAAGAHTPEPVDLGNIREGGAFGTQALSIQNTAASDMFSESLNASIAPTTGDASAAGSFTLLGAQMTDSTSLVVGLGMADVNTAGAKSGTATISLESDGTGTSGITPTVDLGTQTVNISGNVYRLAEFAPLANIDFGNFLISAGVQTQFVTIANTALADLFSEDLNAQFGGVVDNGAGVIGTSGAVSGLFAGLSDSVTMSVTVTPDVAGSIDANVTVSFASAGTVQGVSNGLGVFGLGDDMFQLTGTISGVAGTLAIAGPATPNPVTGTIRVGETLMQDLAISNVASAPAEGLNASFSATSDAAITATGTVGTPGGAPGLAPGATSTSDLRIDVAGNAAGNVTGTATLALESDGSFNSGTVTDLGTQTINVDVDVFRLAAAGAHTPEPVVINARVGDTAEQALSIQNTAASDGFSESLNASIGGATGDASSNGGTFNLLLAQATDSTSLVVNLDTASAGAKSGTATISLESDGTGTSGIVPNVDLGTQTVNVSGNVWAVAVADAQQIVDFGIVHVNDVVSDMAVALGNVGQGALVDDLVASVSAVDAPFDGAGQATIVAGDSNNTDLLIALDTVTAGIFNGTATLGLSSRNPDLADLMLADATVQLMAQVNEFANPVFEFINGDGALGGGGTDFLLDFGNIVQNGQATAELGIRNDVPAPADDLNGAFEIAGAGLFNLMNFDSFSSLSATGLLSDLFVSLTTSGLGLGLFSGDLLFNPFGTNASGFRGALAPITLAFRGNVVDSPPAVPEPGTFVLFVLGVMILGGVTIRRNRAL